jgi:predicted aspartyl protease
VELEAFVDSDAFYSQAPESLLRSLGIEPIDRVVFVTADGRRSTASIGEVVLRLDGRVRRTICVFGEDDAPSLLGAYTLEGFMLGIDPVNERLVRIEGVML